jgi:hypothetical protein
MIGSQCRRRVPFFCVKSCPNFRRPTSTSHNKNLKEPQNTIAETFCPIIDPSYTRKKLGQVLKLL